MLTALLTIGVLVLTVMACISDIRSFRIPDLYSILAIAGFGIAFVVSPEDFGPWWHHLGAGVGMLVVTYIMFALGLLGAGDSKFGAALALWVGLKGLLIYLFYMAIVGGVIGILSKVFHKTKPFKNPPAGSWMDVAQQGKNAVPYGIAISFGAWAGLFHTKFLHQQLDEVFKIIH